MFRVSSAVEQWTVNPLVASSNLAPGVSFEISMKKAFFIFVALAARLHALESDPQIDHELVDTKILLHEEKGTMKKVFLHQDEKKIVGIKVRTNNQAESNSLEGKIFPCVRTYFHENIAEQIPNRLNPSVTYCVYTDYESDHQGDYTYFIGEEVSSLADVPDRLETLIIPAQKYVKFTNGPGSMPDVVRKPWEQIWQMTPTELGGERCYLADYEIYDERSRDHQNIILDIFAGIR